MYTATIRAGPRSGNLRFKTSDPRQAKPTYRTTTVRGVMRLVSRMLCSRHLLATARRAGFSADSREHSALRAGAKGVTNDDAISMCRAVVRPVSHRGFG